MSEPENFLKRWSRRKLDPADDNADKTRADDKPVVARGDAELPAATRAPQAKAAPEPEFDIGSLPPIDSIGADTDISAFLKSGVPSALRHAALRRVWATDSAIRDFKGLQENDWDFNDPSGIHGFGELGPNADVRKMAARLFGEGPPGGAAGVPEPPRAASAQPAPLSQESQESNDASKAAATQLQQGSSVAAGEGLLRREENIATQPSESSLQSAQSKARRHGGALPE